MGSHDIGFFGRDGSKLRGGRGNRGNSSERGSSLHRYSQREQYGEDNYNSVRGDGRDGSFSGSGGFDGNRRSGVVGNSRVGWYGRDGRKEGRRSHSRSGSV